MTDVYAGQPDARQAAPGDADPPPSLFRKRYRQLTPAQIELHDAIKDKADELAHLIGLLGPPVYARLVGLEATSFEMMAKNTRLELRVPDGAGVTLALRHLEDAVYRAVKVLTA